MSRYDQNLNYVKFVEGLNPPDWLAVGFPFRSERSETFLLSTIFFAPIERFHLRGNGFVGGIRPLEYTYAMHPFLIPVCTPPRPP